MSHFQNFNDLNSSGKHDNHTNDTIFSIYSMSYIHWYIYLFIFISEFQDLQNTFLGVPFCIMFWSVKYTFTCPSKIHTFKPVNIDILFLHKIY